MHEMVLCLLSAFVRKDNIRICRIYIYDYDEWDVILCQRHRLRCFLISPLLPSPFFFRYFIFHLFLRSFLLFSLPQMRKDTFSSFFAHFYRISYMSKRANSNCIPRVSLFIANSKLSLQQMLHQYNELGYHGYL